MIPTPILNALESKYYYDNLLFVAQNPKTSWREKLQQLNVTFLSLVNTLTEQREKQIFTGWFAKINFITQAYNLPAETEAELQSLRRLLRRSAVSQKFTPTEVQVRACIKVLAELIARFAGEPLPALLAALWENVALPSLVFKDTPQDVLLMLYATILQKGEIEKDAQGLGHIRLLCDTENFGTITLTISDLRYYNPATGQAFRRYALSEHCAFLVRPHQLVCFTNLEKLEENHFASTSRTLLITSPDYLVDASIVARCVMEQGIQSPYLYLISKLRFFQGTFHTFAGNVINTLLDRLVEQPDADFDTLFQPIYREIQMEAGLLEISNDQLTDVHFQAKNQFPTLQKIVKGYESAQITTEPTFISPRFGLQGRLDMLIEYPQQPERKDLIELKNTSYTNPNFSPAKKEHLAQVACYNLLLDSTFPERRGVSAILYSKDELTPLRDCGKLNFESQDVMWLRNCIVYIDYQIAQGKAKFYDTFLQKLAKLDLPHYTKAEVDTFKLKWQRATALDRDYFAEMMGLIAREMQVAKVGGVSGNEPSQGFAGLWRNSITEKQENFTLLYPLEIVQVDYTKNEIHFRRIESTAVTASRAGDIVVLYPSPTPTLPFGEGLGGRLDGFENNLHPQRYQLLKGNILEIHPDRLTLKLWSKAVDKDFFTKHTHWAVEPNLLEGNYGHQFASLTEFLGASEQHKALIYGQKEPRFASEFQVDYTHLLSAEQNGILNKALSAQDYFLLQGPPGTGKTSKMLRSMVDYLYKNTNEKIVLLAFTNRATDEICQKIEEACGGNYLRLGNMDEGNPFRQKSLKNEADLDGIRQKLRGTRIFVSTVASFYQHFHLLRNCDTLIVDEASQLLEPALVGILPAFKRFILIGDERQLPAVVTQPMGFCQTESADLQQIGLMDMSVSLFERLLLNAQSRQWNDAFRMLATQYRTHHDIAQFISTEFYKTLQIGSETQKLPLTIYDPKSEDANERFLAASRVLFIPSEREPQFKFHRAEARKVADLLQTIRKVYQSKGKFNAETVGVITPYRAQIAEIYKLLDDELREMVTVDTVERYQGSERDIILISMAVNHPAQMRNLQAFNQSMTVDKKWNVALSRAKEQLILLGNPEILHLGKFYSKWLQFYK
jgi:DNA replication ATP-dependent helicase Dna2